MRRLLPFTRSVLTKSSFSQSSQAAALAAATVLALLLAPGVPNARDQRVDAAVPIRPPVVAKATPAGPVIRQIAFDVPMRGYAINSKFGRRTLGGETRNHQGIDMAAPTGTGVFATAEGQVVRTGYDAQGYGSFVEVRHPNGMTSLYGHLSRIDVHSGMTLSAGQRLGLVGSTGRSTGPHLHFEVKRNGRPVNPERVIGRSFPVVVSPA